METQIKEITRLLLQGMITKDEADKFLLDLLVVRNQREQLIDLIKKAQTPKGNCVVDWLMKEYENNKIN
jgi:membrane peptidoglycan carboxypeptidase